MREAITLSPERIHPFVRCVGIGKGLRQRRVHKAYDHRLIAVLAESGVMEIAGRSIETAAGDAFIIAPSTPYRVLSDPEQKIAVVNFDWTWNCAANDRVILSVPEDQFREENVAETADSTFLFADEGGYSYLTFPAGEAGLFDRLCSSYLLNSGGNRSLQLTAQLLYLLTVVIRSRGAEKADESAAEKVYAYILANYEKELTLAGTAEKFHYSPSWLSRLLRKQYNSSFKQIVLDCRLKKALWLLENTNLTCGEIAARVGFYDGQHLSKMFQKKYGEKPTGFR